MRQASMAKRFSSKYAMRITDILSEARVEIWDKMVSILKNPSPSSVLFFIGNTRQGVARMSIIDGAVYCWDASLANHHDVQQIYAPGEKSELTYTIAERDEETFAFAGQEAALQAAVNNQYVWALLSQPSVILVHENGVVDRFQREHA